MPVLLLAIGILLLSAGASSAQEQLDFRLNVYSGCHANADHPATLWSDAHSRGTAEIGDDYISLHASGETPAIVPTLRLPSFRCEGGCRKEIERNARIKDRARIVGNTVEPQPIAGIVWVGDPEALGNISVNIKLKLNEATGAIRKGLGTIQLEVLSWAYADIEPFHCRGYGTIELSKNPL